MDYSRKMDERREDDQERDNGEDGSLEVRYISLEEARELGRAICAQFSRAFEILKDK